MKAIIVNVLTIVVLANGLDEGIHGQSSYTAGHHDVNPYKHLFRIKRSNRICTPRVTKRVDCLNCLCSGDGDRWYCTELECPQTVSGHSIPDDSINRPDQVNRILLRSKRDGYMDGPDKLNRVLLRSKREKECSKKDEIRVIDCFTCYCDSDGFYSTCFSDKQCDLYNSSNNSTNRRSSFASLAYQLA